MLPLLLHLYTMRLGEAGAPIHPRIESETRIGARTLLVPRSRTIFFPCGADLR